MVVDTGKKLKTACGAEVDILGLMLRDVEQAKIHCGREHFKALGEESRYVVSSNYETFIDQAGK